MTDSERALAHLPVRALEAASSLAARTLAQREHRALAPAVRTLVVDSADPACYTTIGAAVTEAQTWDRVLVRPGHYVESVRVDKAIVIEGEGDREAIVVEGPDLPAFVLSADKASIRGVTVTGGPDHDNSASKEDFWRFAAMVVTADVLVTDVAVRNEWTDGISVSHSSAPTIRGNDIHRCEGTGIAVFDSSTPTIAGNDIHENTFGIGVMDGSAPLVKGNDIRENDDEGLSVAGSAAPTITGNDIHANKWGGIWVLDSAAPTITGNDIHGNGHHGLWVTDSAAPTVTGNGFHGNDRRDIEVAAGSTASIDGREVTGPYEA